VHAAGNATVFWTDYGLDAQDLELLPEPAQCGTLPIALKDREYASLIK